MDRFEQIKYAFDGARHIAPKTQHETAVKIASEWLVDEVTRLRAIEDAAHYWWANVVDDHEAAKKQDALNENPRPSDG